MFLLVFLHFSLGYLITVKNNIQFQWFAHIVDFQINRVIGKKGGTGFFFLQFLVKKRFREILAT